MSLRDWLKPAGEIISKNNNKPGNQTPTGSTDFFQA